MQVWECKETVQTGGEKDLRISAESLAAKGEKPTGLSACITDPFPKLKGFGPQKRWHSLIFLSRSSGKKRERRKLILITCISSTHWPQSDRCFYFSPPSLQKPKSHFFGGHLLHPQQ